MNALSSLFKYDWLWLRLLVEIYIFLLNQKWERWNYLYSLGTTSVALELPRIEFSLSFVWTIFSITIFGLIGSKEGLFHQD